MEKIWIKKELYILSYELLKFVSFSNFYLIFIWFLLSIFFIKIAKKGISYLQVMTWRAGPGGELTWRTGPPRGCNAALRPHGRVVGVPREAQVAHRTRTRGRRPRVSTQVHADACVGRHVAMGANIWRAHGLVGPGKKFGAVTQMRYRAPIFILTIFRYFFRVGQCPTHVLPFAGDMDARRASDSVWTAEIAWTRVHAIIKSSTCAKYI